MYPRLSRLARYLYTHVAKLSWAALLLLAGGHFVASWLALWLAGEAELSRPEIYWYFYVTTGTTVGYGDFSPVTDAGRMVTALLVMPGGIALLTIIIGKLVQLFSDHGRRWMRGLGDYSYLDNHIVILGWYGERTRKMVEHILGDTRRLPREIVLCAASDYMDNPLPEAVKYLRDSSISRPELLQRAGVAHASVVIALGADDNETLAAALAAAALNEDVHLVAWFEQPALAQILKAHCPQAECNVSLAIEMLVRSAQDPGSSRVHQQLLSNLEGPTQYSLTVPAGIPALSYGQVFNALKLRHEATLFGVARRVVNAGHGEDDGGENSGGGVEDLQLNAPFERPVAPGDVLYFIAASRLRGSDVDWAAIAPLERSADGLQ